nr:MAG: hypothetical protein [Caudoviricetes sp.]
MTNIFFSSDLHFGHANILKYEPISRQFDSVEEMDEQLIQNWNNVVKENDECYILGDLSFHKLNKTVEILNRLSGKKAIIVGNHDAHLIKHQEFIDCFEGRVFDLLDHKINGKHYVMCHYPLRAWNRSHWGSINLFGHLHSKWKGNKQQLNVGADVHNLTPLSIEEIPAILESLPEEQRKIYD